MDPKISVIIPVYNGEEFIAQTLDRALGQEYPAHEVIVVDDGSTDRTPEILKRCGGRIVYRRIPNAGPSAARNEGMRLATGDWLAFLDADDYWFRNKLKKQAEMIRKYPEIGLLCCNYTVRYDYLGFRLVKHFSVLKNRREMNFDAPLEKDAFRLLVKENFIGTPSSVVLRKALADRVGPYNPAYHNSQDFDYWLRCALETNFIVMSDVLLLKKTHAGNLSGNKLSHFAAHRQILEDTRRAHEHRLRAQGLEPVVRNAVAETDYFYGSACFEAGDKIGAFGTYWRGLWDFPTLSNAFRFLWTVSKKLLRVVTFDRLSRKHVKFFRRRPPRACR